MENISLAIVEDNPTIRESLESYLSAAPGITISFVADSVESFLTAIEVVHEPKIDVMLLDIGLPGMSGLEGIRFIKEKMTHLNIIMLTTFEEEEKIFKALCAGAVSYISKRTPLSSIQEAIYTIYRGGSYMSPSIARKVINHFAPKPKTETANLTPRQQQIVQAVVDGLSYKMIADKLMISLDTVRDHIKKIYRLLEINSKGELIKKAIDGGVL